LGEDEEQKDKGSDTDDSDVVVMGRRKATKARTRRDDPTNKQAAQKRGLDAEDDYGDAEQNDEEGEGDAEEEPEDSEFEESDDGEGDDYNAENYFDTGEADEDEGGGGDDDGGYY